MNKIFNLLLQGPQEGQRHSVGRQKHHPCNIVEAGLSNYYVKPEQRNSTSKSMYKLYHDLLQTQFAFCNQIRKEKFGKNFKT